MPQYINISKAIHELDAAVTPAAGDLVAIDRNDGGTWVTLKADIDDLPGGGGASAFTGLSDTPANYTGAGGKLVVVNSTPDGLEFDRRRGFDCGRHGWRPVTAGNWNKWTRA
jgi:hypothetical protein